MSNLDKDKLISQNLIVLLRAGDGKAVMTNEDTIEVTMDDQKIEYHRTLKHWTPVLSISVPDHEKRIHCGYCVKIDNENHPAAKFFQDLADYCWEERERKRNILEESFNYWINNLENLKDDSKINDRGADE